MHARMEAPAAPVEVGRVTMYPILGYGDAPTAIEWLVRVFGFEPIVVMKNDDDSIGHAELRLGDGVIMPTSRQKNGGSEHPWDQPLTTQGLYVALDGLDAHYARAVAEGAEIVRPLADTAYGSREYTARDPEGNLWSFGTYRPRDGSPRAGI